MVKIKTNGIIYDYPGKVLSTHIIDKNIRDDFQDFFKRHKMKKSTFLEELAKELLFMERIGTLKKNNFVVTLDIRRLGMRPFRRD